METTHLAALKDARKEAVEKIVAEIEELKTSHATTIEEMRSLHATELVGAKEVTVEAKGGDKWRGKLSSTRPSSRDFGSNMRTRLSLSRPSTPSYSRVHWPSWAASHVAELEEGAREPQHRHRKAQEGARRGPADGRDRGVRGARRVGGREGGAGSQDYAATRLTG